MSRRVLSLVIALAAVVAACGGGSKPELTDPKEILVQAASSLQGVKTIHLAASLAGKIDPSMLSGGSSSNAGATLDLSGSTLEGDIDIAGSEAHLAALLPSLFGLNADLVVDGGIAYLKTSLTGTQYHKLDPATLTGSLPLPSLSTLPSPDASAVAALIDQFRAELDKLPAATKLADEKIGDVDCYHVQVKVTSADVPQPSGALGGLSGTATLDVFTRKSDYRPARLAIALDGGAQGNLTLTLDLTKYDEAVSIAAPPADQVSDEPLSIPGLTP